MFVGSRAAALARNVRSIARKGVGAFAGLKKATTTFAPVQAVSMRYFSTMGEDEEEKAQNEDPFKQASEDLFDDPLNAKTAPPPEETSSFVPPQKKENVVGERHDFQAETKQLLDIVTNSIYTEKEVFLRELVSNASDALEKLRHVQVSGKQVNDPEIPLEVNIYTDEKNNTITIRDSGIGMTKEEMASNLGVIARSGSKNFLQQNAGEVSNR